jgi:hypothetical protein
VSEAPTSRTIADSHYGDGPGIYGYTDGTYSPGDTGLRRPGGLSGGCNIVIGIRKANGGYDVDGQNQWLSGDLSAGVCGESSSATGWAGCLWSSGKGVCARASSATAWAGHFSSAGKAVIATYVLI